MPNFRKYIQFAVRDAERPLVIVAFRTEKEVIVNVADIDGEHPTHPVVKNSWVINSGIDPEVAYRDCKKRPTVTRSLRITATVDGAEALFRTWQGPSPGMTELGTIANGHFVCEAVLFSWLPEK